MSLRPVHRIKHVIDAQGATVAGTTEIINLIAATDTPTLAVPTSVETGAKVNGIFLTVEIFNSGTTGVLSNAYMLVAKNNGGNLGAIAPNAVGVDDDKRFVIHQEMVMLEAQDNSNPRTLFKGVIVLPRGYKRFGPNDTLILELLAPGVEINWCVQCHYKEFR